MRIIVSTQTVSINQPTKQCFAAIAQVKSGVQTLASLSTAKLIGTCNYTSHMGRWMRGLEILPPAHARTHTHTQTQLCQKCTDLLSALSTCSEQCRHQWIRVDGNLRTERLRRQAPSSQSFAHKKNRQCFSNGAEVCMWLGPPHRQAKHKRKQWS